MKTIKKSCLCLLLSICATISVEAKSELSGKEAKASIQKTISQAYSSLLPVTDLIISQSKAQCQAGSSTYIDYLQDQCATLQAKLSVLLLHNYINAEINTPPSPRFTAEQKMLAKDIRDNMENQISLLEQQYKAGSIPIDKIYDAKIKLFSFLLTYQHLLGLEPRSLDRQLGTLMKEYLRTN